MSTRRRCPVRVLSVDGDNDRGPAAGTVGDGAGALPGLHPAAAFGGADGDGVTALERDSGRGTSIRDYVLMGALRAQVRLTQ